jgi:acetolactate synthase-1/2/3 large subunit
VYLEVPIDLVHSSISTEAPVRGPASAAQRRLRAPTALIEEAARLLQGARRPAVVAGSGVWWSGASGELRSFVESSRIPVVTRQQGRGTVPDDHELCFGRDWQNVVAQADVLLVIGTRLNYFFGYGHFPHLEHMIQVDIDPGELGRADLDIVGDAGAVLEQLAGATPALATEDWVARLRRQADDIAARKEEMGRSDSTPIHPMRLCTEISARLDRDATVVTDGSNNLMWTGVAFRALEPGHMPSMAPLGTIGLGSGYALAAACARPGSQVLWVVGDGSFGFHAMELDTAARHDLPIVTVIMNNCGWSAGWVPLGLRHYERMAGAFDGHGELVEKPDQIGPALDAALASKAPSILNVMIDSAPDYFAGRFPA